MNMMNITRPEPTPIEPGRELYVAMIHARMAAEYLLTAHIKRDEKNEIGANFNHTYAMHQLELMADALGLKITERKQVAA